MPPRKYKVQHHRDRHVGGFDEVARRNEELTKRDEEGGGGYAPKKEQEAPVAAKKKKEPKEEVVEESGSDDGVVFGEEKPSKKKGTGVGGLETNNPNAGTHMVDRDGVQMTRKQKEAMEKEAARRRYEELHKQGKTDEAKADLARLEEVKKRREEAKAKKEQEEAAAKAAAAEKSSKKGMTKEVKEALGGEDARLRGQRSQANKNKDSKGKDEDQPKRGAGNDDEIYVAYASGGTTKTEDTGPKEAGSMAACREAEDDFM